MSASLVPGEILSDRHTLEVDNEVLIEHRVSVACAELFESTREKPQEDVSKKRDAAMKKLDMLVQG